jgi:hypothetical protein
LNYSDSKLKLVFVAHVRFADGASSLIKSETTWGVKQEEQVSMQMNLTKKEIKEEVQSFKGVHQVSVKSKKQNTALISELVLFCNFYTND